MNWKNKIILNIDETWLGTSDFRRRKWMFRVDNPTVAQMYIAPRVSMISALDTNGEVYFSLLQVNTNTKAMSIFLVQLVKLLNKKDKNWRKRYVVLQDNAQYHKSGEMLKLLEKLDIPVLYTGPHSYSAVPIKLWFAAFKSVDINPRHIPMGKK